MEKPQKPSWAKYEDIPEYERKTKYDKVEAQGNRQEGYVRRSAQNLSEAYDFLHGRGKTYTSYWGNKEKLDPESAWDRAVMGDGALFSDIDGEGRIIDAVRKELVSLLYDENEDGEILIRKLKELREINDQQIHMPRRMFADIAEEAVAYHINKGNIDRAKLINDNVPGVSVEFEGPLDKKDHLLKALRRETGGSWPDVMSEELLALPEVHTAALDFLAGCLEGMNFFQYLPPDWVSLADRLKISKDELITSPKVIEGAKKGMFDILLRIAKYSIDVSDEKNPAKYTMSFFGFPESVLQEEAAKVCRQILIHSTEQRAKNFAEHYAVSEEVLKSIAAEVQKEKENGEAK